MGRLAWVFVCLAACAPFPGTRLVVRGFPEAPEIAPSAYEHYLLGRLAATREDHETAIAELRLAAEAAPDRAEPRVALAEELLAAGRLTQARTELDAVIAGWPDDAPAWLVRGRIRMADKDPKGAVQAFERATRLDPDGAAGYLLGASTWQKLGQPARAERVYRSLLSRVPDSGEGFYQLGRLLLARKAWTDAESALSQAVAIDADDIDARVSLADAYRRSGRAELAVRTLREAFDRSGEDAWVGRRLVAVLLEGGDRAGALDLIATLDVPWRTQRTRLDLGYLYLALRSPDGALRVADGLLGVDSTYQPARLLRARALVQRQRRAEAITVLLEIPQTADEHASARAMVGDLLAREGKLAEAIHVVETSLRDSPDETNLLIARATLHEKGGDPARARALLDAALSHRPDSEEVLFARAALEERTGDPDRAVSLVRRLLQDDPDNVGALNFVGYSWANRGIHLAESEKLLRRAVEISPDDGFVLDSLGWSLFRGGKLDEAGQVLERADRLTPDEPEILLHLGEVQLRRGELGQARDTFRRALGLDPEDQVRRKLEDQVKALDSGIHAASP